MLACFTHAVTYFYFEVDNLMESDYQYLYVKQSWTARLRCAAFVFAFCDPWIDHNVPNGILMHAYLNSSQSGCIVRIMGIQN